MAEKESFDFPIKRIPLTVRWGGQNYSTEKDGIFRLDTKQVIGYVSAENIKEVDEQGKIVKKNKNYYKIIEHKELVDNARRVIGKMGLKTVESSVLTNNGARLYHQFDFPDVRIQVPNKKIAIGDYVSMKTTLTNSYDLSRRAGYEVGGNRKACSNGLCLFKTAFFYLYKHTGAFDLDKALQELERGIKTFQIDMAQQMSALAETEIATEVGIDLIDALVKSKDIPEKYGIAAKSVWINPANANRVIPQYDADGKIEPDNYRTIVTNTDLDKARNLWSFYNAFTLILTHMVISHERRILMYTAIQRKIQEYIKKEKALAMRYGLNTIPNPIA